MERTGGILSIRVPGQSGEAMRDPWSGVIASAAKQSRGGCALPRDCRVASLLAMTVDRWLARPSGVHPIALDRDQTDRDQTDRDQTDRDQTGRDPGDAS